MSDGPAIVLGGARLGARGHRPRAGRHEPVVDALELPAGAARWWRADRDAGGRAPSVRRRYLLCTTPALGHTVPLLALSRRLVDQGDEVAFYTTPHYEERVKSTGAEFLPFEQAFDAHDLMVVNPEREASSKRGVAGSRTTCAASSSARSPDRRRTCDDPRGLRGRLHRGRHHVPRGAPLGVGPRAERPALACVGVMPYSQPSRDTAPFGIGMQPGRGALAGAQPSLNWLTVHGALADIQRFTRARLAEAGAQACRPTCSTSALAGRCLLPGDGGRVRVPAVGPGADGALRGADPGAAFDGVSDSPSCPRGGPSCRRTARWCT